jgi:proline racemase
MTSGICTGRIIVLFAEHHSLSGRREDMRQSLKTIDAHVAGEPLRLVVEGVPRPSGRTMAQKRDWMERHADDLRRALVLEPRGHRDMCGAIFTDPVSPGSDAGLIFFHNAGYPSLSGHGAIAAATIALERNLLPLAASNAAGHEASVLFDTVAGTVHVRPRLQTHGDTHSIDSVLFTNVPAFVWSGSQSVRLGSRELRVDIAFGGVFYAIVDTEAIGIPFDGSRLPELRRLGIDIRAAVNAAVAVSHPADETIAGVDGVIFTGPPQDPEAHLRNVTVFADGAVDRSPCATGTSAVMAVLDAMGLLLGDQPFVHESIIGTLHRGRVTGRTQVGEYAAIITEIEATAAVTGEHTFFIDDDDPLREGFEL